MLKSSFIPLICLTVYVTALPAAAQLASTNHQGKTVAIGAPEHETSFRVQEIKAMQRILRYYRALKLSVPPLSVKQPPSAFNSWQAYELHLRGRILNARPEPRFLGWKWVPNPALKAAQASRQAALLR